MGQSKSLFAYIKNYPKSFIIGILALLVSSFSATLSPRIIGLATDAFQQGKMTGSNIWLYILGILGVVALSAVAMVVTRRTIQAVSYEIQFDLRHDLFTHFTRLDAAYYDNHRIGDLMTRLTADLNAVRMLVGVAIFQGLTTSLTILFALLQMFSLNVTLTLLTLVIMPIITLTFFFFLQVIHRRYKRVQQQFSNISAMAQENFSGIRVVKGFGIESREIDNFKSLNDTYIGLNLSLTRVDGPLSPLMNLLFGATVSLLLLVGGRYVLGLGSGLTIGGFVAFILLFNQVEWPLIGLGWIANVAQRGMTSWGRLREIFEDEPEITDGPETDYTLKRVKGGIEFRHVTLDYGGFKALDDVSFKIHPGERVGITGRLGSGKTQIVNLIARLADPTEGQVLIDGIDVRRYPLETLRRNIGMVPQEPFLFSDSIGDNVAYGVELEDAEKRDIQIRETARLVQLAGDVEDFPEGYETGLGERGITLSGGQRQRAAMARAIIRKPPILILDDALSAVDTQTEARILTGLREVARGRTTLIVAHRVSAFQNVDRILVLDEGHIIEQGTHAELAAKGGYYADINRKQQLEDSLEAA